MSTIHETGCERRQVDACDCHLKWPNDIKQSHNPAKIDSALIPSGYRFLTVEEMHNGPTFPDGVRMLHRGRWTDANLVWTNEMTYIVPVPSVTEYHNPENVPADKVPQGWRFMRAVECDGRFAYNARVWTRDHFSEWKANYANILQSTYIVPIDPREETKTESVATCPECNGIPEHLDMVNSLGCLKCDFTGTLAGFLMMKEMDEDAMRHASDPINPDHYTHGGIECIDAIKASMTPEEFRGFLKGQVFKYNWRMGHKGSPVEDSRKAAWYQDRLTKELVESNS